MIEYFLGGVCLTILLIFFIKILYTEYNKRNVVKTQSCKIERYIIKQYYDVVVVKDRLIDRDICQFEIKDTEVAYELAELCVKRIGGCEDD